MYGGARGKMPLLPTPVGSPGSTWKIVLDSKVAVPTNILRIFDDNGDLLSFDNGCRNGNDGPEFNVNDGPEIDTNVSNNESLSGMKGNESLTDTNNSLILGISPIRPLLSPTQKQRYCTV